MAQQARASLDAVTSYIESELGAGPVVKEVFNGSSSWSSAYTYETATSERFFVKLALGRDSGMFEGEAAGLQAMYGTHTLRVPKVLHVGALSGGGSLRSGGSFIIMEYLNLSGGRYDQADLGRQLAQMHLAPPPPPTPEAATAGEHAFGFHVDNTIGGTPQPNGWMGSWVDFFRERRLRHMLRLVGDPGLSRMGDKLCDNLETLFEGAGEIRPSVLHGDLWSGNVAAVDGQPCIFDPATSYGHSEMEFGMSWCAGFNQQFWNAYHDVIPRAHGFQERKQLYELYHYLNHAVLFGSSYYGQCDSILKNLTRKF